MNDEQYGFKIGDKVTWIRQAKRGRILTKGKILFIKEGKATVWSGRVYWKVNLDKLSHQQEALMVQQWQEVPVPAGAAIAHTGYNILCSKEEIHYFKADQPQPGDLCNCGRAVYREDGYCELKPALSQAATP